MIRSPRIVMSYNIAYRINKHIIKELLEAKNKGNLKEVIMKYKLSPSIVKKILEKNKKGVSWK